MGAPLPPLPPGTAVTGDFAHNLEGQMLTIGTGADTLTRTAISTFLGKVNARGATTGQIIAAAAELKTQLGASKAYYDVISTLADDLKRLISDAVK